MGLAFTKLFARLFSKKEMRILMVRALPLRAAGLQLFDPLHAALKLVTALGADRGPLQVGLDAAGKTTILYKLKLG